MTKTTKRNVDIYDFNKERKKILEIQVGTQHRLYRDRWLKRKNVYDVIFKSLDTGIGDSKFIDIPPNKFIGHHIKEDEYLNIVSQVIYKLNEAKIISMPFVEYKRKEGLVESTRRTFMRGVTISIENMDAFENQHSKISEFCNFVERDGKERFPEFYPSKDESQKISRQLQLKAIRNMYEEGLKKEELKKEIIKELAESKEEVKKQNKQPYCIIEGKWGFLKFSKQGQKIRIGQTNSRHFRLLQFLSSPIDSAKTINSVFDAIKLPKDKNDQMLNSYNAHQSTNRKIDLIEYAKKELQKNKELQGKFKFELDSNQKTYRLQIV